MNTKNCLNLSEFEITFYKTLYELDQSKKLSIYITLTITLIGLFGNFFTISIFIQKKLRTNSFHVFLLCLAFNDSLILLIYLFEDILKNNKFGLILPSRSSLICWLINYLRSVLRFSSAYLILVSNIGIQRLIVLFKPFLVCSNHKKTAWLTVILVSVISLLINSWIPILFKTQTNISNELKCGFFTENKSVYLLANLTFASMTIIIPVIFCLITSCLAFYKTKTISNSDKRENFKLRHFDRHGSKLTRRSGFKQRNNNNDLCLSMKSRYYTCRSRNRSRILSRYITLQVSCISFVCVLFSLPYLSVWLAFLYMSWYSKHVNQSFISLLLQIAEIFYVLNYGIKFYVYYASSSWLLKRFKHSSIIRENTKTAKQNDEQV